MTIFKTQKQKGAQLSTMVIILSCVVQSVTYLFHLHEGQVAFGAN